jgi:TRAP-type C4-dicarboxylate transport system permease small subunit
MTKIILKFDDVLEKISRWGLVASLFAILSFAVISIVLRWMGQSVMWLEPLTRHLVFLSAFLGGSLATSKNVHIRVDLLTRLVEMTKSKALKWITHNLVNLFCLITCMALAWAGYEFYKVELEYGAPAFLNIHSGWLVAIIPAGMGLIALRFFNQLLLSLIGAEIEHHSV